MVTLSIKTNFPDVQASLDRLQDGVRNQALGSAINKTLDQAKTAMTRAIAEEFNVTQAYVRERLRIRYAMWRNKIVMDGSLIGGKAGAKRSANMIAFVEKFVTTGQAKKRRKAGTLDRIFVRILRSGGLKPLVGNYFIGNKGRTLFQRVGPGRLDIKPAQTIDVAQMFNTKRINAVVIKTMLDKFPAVFAHEAQFYTDRFNARRK